MTEQHRLRCTGCGSTMTDDELRELKKRDPHIISCCPERDMRPDDAVGEQALDGWYCDRCKQSYEPKDRDYRCPNCYR